LSDEFVSFRLLLADDHILALEPQRAIDDERSVIAAIPHCLTERFDAPDLKEAKALFEELS
jgi:hypothetical protein